MARQDLERFKELMESGEIPTTDGQPAGRGIYGEPGTTFRPCSRVRGTMKATEGRRLLAFELSEARRASVVVRMDKRPKPAS